MITLCPEIFPGGLSTSVIGKGLKNGIWQLNVINIRDFAKDKHKTVDDTCTGGGPGMLIKPDIAHLAIEFAIKSLADKGFNEHVFLHPSPRGKVFCQEIAHELSQAKSIIFLCSRYEGIDQRIINLWNFEDISIGNYILTNGDIAASVIMDACIRLLPGILHNATSFKCESFANDLLECDNYTKPTNWNGIFSPSVLSSGNHADVIRWKSENSQMVTKTKRPDLWRKYLLNRSEND
ncbi:tRNA (guanosine(37)-N1)-methyltransferase TrmD [Candidatus Gromoviella agglomerans]|uniref:tRNA (guanosine(37)-N1)-methyltransferase TrmD n=1 Tax=Candidatus Gromoviella agglomerans TaxID=2806609 RepID=UPI001E5D98AA|nr:tRNA (guanosine(37)-N1)-methyltransferase TrmD [Candidatus Gromoviella agglomerans]UFX98514.1 tRNA (guanine-N(1)-)-methyltransferase [Candidatus Gromoviella agglomerans]